MSQYLIYYKSKIKLFTSNICFQIVPIILKKKLFET